MSFWTSARVAEAVGSRDPGGVTFTAVSTDTRSLQPGDLFVALKGERFDAHDYLDRARQAGAAGVVVRRGAHVPAGLATFEVADTLSALGALARARRRGLPAGTPVVAITGSSGKTSTKEMIRAALGARFRVHATSGNLNNLVGVPLTLLAASDGVEAVVVEAGASLPGEIPKLRAVIEPTIAVVTNVGTAHLEGFGTQERLLAEKVSLLDGCPVAVTGAGAALVSAARGRAGRLVVAGREPGAAGVDVRPDAVTLDSNGRPVVTWQGHSVTLPVFGLHQVENAMIALGVALAASVEPAAALRALAGVRVPAGRGALIESGALLVLDDTYNANPDSMLAAFEAAGSLAAQRGRPLAVVIGSMLELGAESARLHAAVADALLERSPRPAVVAAVGDFVPAFERHRAALGEHLLTAPDAAELGPRLRAALRGDEVVLVKASRGVALERVLPHLT